MIDKISETAQDELKSSPEKISTREKVQYALERLDENLFDPSDKMSILQVLAGDKPTAIICSNTHKSGTGIKTMQTLIDTNIIGLKSSIFKVPVDKDFVNENVLIGAEQEYIEKLEEALSNNAKDHHLIGQILGYPKTAIDAFAPLEDPSKEYIPDEIKKHPLYKFLPYRLSRDNHQAEWDKFLGSVEHTVKSLPEEYTKQMLSKPATKN